MADDETLTDEERAAIGHAWREFVENRAHGGKLHYSQPAIRGQPSRGSFRIPRDVFEVLGDGDLKVGGAIIHQMFGVEDDPQDATTIHGSVVRLLGAGDLAKGRKVLERFVQRVRHGARDDGVVLQHDGLPHDDGSHGWSVRR
jgi:hypothetical protein